MFANQSDCSFGWHATVTAPASRARASMSSTGPSAETKRSRFSARACADRFPVSALRVSSTPGRTTIRYASQARFVSRSSSARYASQLSFVIESRQRMGDLPEKGVLVDDVVRDRDDVVAGASEQCPRSPGWGGARPTRWSGRGSRPGA